MCDAFFVLILQQRADEFAFGLTTGEPVPQFISADQPIHQHFCFRHKLNRFYTISKKKKVNSG